MEINGIKFKKFVQCGFFSPTGIFTPQAEYSYTTFDKSDLKDIQAKVLSHHKIKTKGSEIEPEKLGSIYFSKTATVPRYKVREIKDKYNLSVVRDSTKADTIVISKDEVINASSYTWSQYLCKRSIVTDVIEALLSEKVTASFLNSLRPYRHERSVTENIEKKDEIQKALDTIKQLPEDVEYICFNYGGREKFFSLADAMGYSGISTKSGNHNFDCTLIDNFLTYGDKNIITDSALQSILGSSDLEHENYVFIDQLLKTNDPGNIELGLTLMANCNFEGSQHYLLILLGDYYNRHRYVKYCHSVAFKSLLDFMDFDKYTSVSLDDILSKADSMGKLTDDIRTLVFERAMDEFEHSFKKYKWIKVKGIEIVKPENDTNQGGN